MAKRGNYSKGAKEFPTEVATPVTEEEYKKLGKAITVTQRNIQRWAGVQPENCKRAEAYLALQCRARTLYRQTLTPDDRRDEAVQGLSQYDKQKAVVEREQAKLFALGRSGFEQAIDANHTEESLAAASDGPEESASSTAKRPRVAKPPPAEIANAMAKDKEAKAAMKDEEKKCEAALKAIERNGLPAQSESPEQ